MRAPQALHRLHLLRVERVRLAPAFDELKEPVFESDLLVKPDGRAVAVSNVPEAVDLDAVNHWHPAAASSLARCGHLHRVILPPGRALARLLRLARVFLPPLFLHTE